MLQASHSRHHHIYLFSGSTFDNFNVVKFFPQDWLAMQWAICRRELRGTKNNNKSWETARYDCIFVWMLSSSRMTHQTSDHHHLDGEQFFFVCTKKFYSSLGGRRVQKLRIIADLCLLVRTEKWMIYRHVWIFYKLLFISQWNFRWNWWNLRSWKAAKKKGSSTIKKLKRCEISSTMVNVLQCVIAVLAKKRAVNSSWQRFQCHIAHAVSFGSCFSFFFLSF